MKKFCVILSLLVAFSSCVMAEFVGFQDNNGTKTSITEALKMSDNSYVTVQGNIVKRLSEDKYQFKDSTGTMTVEIDKDKWGGISVNTQDKLELTGEIEKKFNSAILDVDTVTKISTSK